MRTLLIIATGLFLTGCSSHRTRPAHGPSKPQARGQNISSPPAFRDDTSRSQASRYRDSNDSVPNGPPPDISKLAEPVPKPEARALYGNKSPYTVRGQTYKVLPNARGYYERGIASFYGNKFHGYKTSSLEDYDMYAFTAASKTLPLPSYARVTNLENGKSVVVRVNDRGPFHANRVIDLSYVAAIKIGIWRKGTGLVEVRGIDPTQGVQELPPPPVVTAHAHPGIYLQVGAFSDADNAQRVADQLRRANFAPVQVLEAEVNGQRIRRVRVGPLQDVNRVDEVSTQIEHLGLPRPQVAVD